MSTPTDDHPSNLYWLLVSQYRQTDPVTGVVITRFYCILTHKSEQLSKDGRLKKCVHITAAEQTYNYCNFRKRNIMAKYDNLTYRYITAFILFQ